MKQKVNTLSKNFTAVKVFLDDLSLIESILKEGCSDIKFETKDYEFSSVEELQNTFGNQNLSQLKISTWEPYITIRLDQLSARLYCGSDKTKDVGIFYKLNTVLSRAQRKPAFLYSYWSFLTGNILLSLVSLLPESYLPKILFVGVGVVFIFWVCWVSYIRLLKTSDIILSAQTDIKSFWFRNKDQVVVGVFIAIITALLTVIVTTYLQPAQDFLRQVFNHS